MRNAFVESCHARCPGYVVALVCCSLFVPLASACGKDIPDKAAFSTVNDAAQTQVDATKPDDAADTAVPPGDGVVTAEEVAAADGDAAPVDTEAPDTSAPLEVDGGGQDADAAGPADAEVASAPEVTPDAGTQPVCSTATACGNGTCEPGEGPLCCPIDCCGSCGDGKCMAYACGEHKKDGPDYCDLDCTTPCGNGICEKGETPAICAEDCNVKACGNSVCEQGEDPASCGVDCGTGCGNCTCDPGEHYTTCPVDCGFCGDGYCSNCKVGEGKAESAATCPADCK